VQFESEVLFTNFVKDLFVLFPNTSACFGCFETGPRHPNRQFFVGFSRQTENQPKQFEFMFSFGSKRKKLFASRTPSTEKEYDC
jgi:hypothetical protein